MTFARLDALVRQAQRTLGRRPYRRAPLLIAADKPAPLVADDLLIGRLLPIGRPMATYTIDAPLFPWEEQLPLLALTAWSVLCFWAGRGTA